MTCRPLSLLIATLLLVGCQDPPAAPEPQAAVAPKEAEATELRDAIQEPIDKAEATEDATLKAAEEQKQQIEDAGG